MPVACPLADPDGHYQRTVTGWVDAGDGQGLRLTARLVDPQADLEAWLDVRPSPSFEVLAAGGRVLRGGALISQVVRPEELAKLAGQRVIPGFRRRVVEALGPSPLTGHLADTVIEAARLSRQVTRLAGGVPADADAARFRELDLEGWPELRDMCFTYSAAGGRLFGERAVRVPATLDMYAPRPGARLVFHRYKRTTIDQAGDVLTLYQSLFDQVHGFELWYDVDVRTRRVLGARSLTPRLPYLGVCDEPQGRVRALIGQVLDEGWPATIREVTGGSGGCFQLTDLTADLLRLLAFSPR